jgi:hypothetical protein
MENIAVNLMPAPFEKRQFVVDNASWLPIKPPFSCDLIHIHNIGKTDINMRTSWMDAGTEQILPLDGIEELGAVVVINSSDHNFLFKKDKPVLWLQSIAKPGLIVVDFLI